MVTTSFGQSIRRNQHCINFRSHLGSAVSFVLNQLQKYDIRDYQYLELAIQLSFDVLTLCFFKHPHMFLLATSFLSKTTTTIV